MNPDEAVAMLSPKDPPEREYIPTGSLALDVAMRGYPVGRVTEITGDPNSGKTVLAHMAVREMQKRGVVAYVDLDGEFSPVRASAAGIDIDELLVLRTIPANFGPVRYAVIDGVTSKGSLPQLSQGDRRGPLTIVATSWRYRMNSGVFPWIDLAHARSGPTVATVVDGTSPQDRTASLHFGPGGLDRGKELLELGMEAGLITKRGSNFYDPAHVHLGSSVASAARVLSEKSAAESLDWLRSRVLRILTERQAGK